MIPYEKKEHYTIDDLAEIVTLLRSEEGCPWDSGCNLCIRSMV